MILGPMSKAWFSGLAVLLIAYGTWLLALQVQAFSRELVVVLWASPCAAGFLTAYLSPRMKVLLGASLAIPTAIMATLLNLLYESLGNVVDFGGARGSATLLLITLVYSTVLCVVGGVAGLLLTKSRA